MRLIRQGDVGPEVQDVQRRLADLGLSVVEDLPGEFGSETRDLLRTFQQQRGLVADGVVGPDTWRLLVEAGYALGDRLLYLRRPMLRGDDVRELQRRLGQLGFDAGRDDGIFGPDTAAAVAEFQVNTGLESDGKVGAATVAALRRLHRTHQEVPAATVDERYALHAPVEGITGARLLIDPGNGPDDPGFCSPDGALEHEIAWEIANRVHGRLAALGANPVLARGPATTPTASERADLANREDVVAILSVHTNGLDSASACGVSTYYFGSGPSISERGRRLAELVLERLVTATGSPNCRSHPSTSALLRESHAPAVIAEIGFLTHPEEGRRLARPEYRAQIAEALVDALLTYLEPQR